MCELLNCLPNPGGLFQQLPMHIKLMEQVFRARNVAESEKLKNPNRKSETDQPGPVM